MLSKQKRDDRRAGQSSPKIVNLDLPLFYRNKNLTAREARVISLIPRGIDHKVSMPELARLTEMDTRAVQSIIYVSKLKGVPICCSRKAKDSGYYIPTTEEERAIGLVNLKHQANKILEGIVSVANSNLDSWEDMTGYEEALNANQN